MGSLSRSKALRKRGVIVYKFSLKAREGLWQENDIYLGNFRSFHSFGAFERITVSMLISIVLNDFLENHLNVV